MRSQRVTETWEFYRDNCPGFKEPMRKRFRELDEYVVGLEVKNAKLRELVRELLVTISWCSLDYCPSESKRRELVDKARELGVEVGE